MAARKGTLVTCIKCKKEEPHYEIGMCRSCYYKGIIYWPIEKKLTPKKAVAVECKLCLDTRLFRGCDNDGCQLNEVHRSSYIKKIKAHCLQCAPDHSAQGVRKCSGEVFNPAAHICPLHPYRMGKNPRRSAQGKKNSALLKHNLKPQKRKKG